MNVIGLILWIFQLAMAIAWTISGKPINHVLYILAVLVCILHYVEELVR